MTLDESMGCFIGGAIGDALGGPVEFKSEGSFPLVTEMIGGGVFDLAEGEWTDDTAMAVCIADAYIKSRRFNSSAIVHNFQLWLENGSFGTRDHCFDVGVTTHNSLFNATGMRPYAGENVKDASGNGSIMRSAPIAIFNWRNPYDAVADAVACSLITHGNTDTIRYMTAWMAELLEGKQIEQFYRLRPYNFRQENGKGSIMYAYNRAWDCVLSTSSFEEAVVKAVNFGDDADTVGAVTGILAGRIYGYKNIPQRWLDKLFQLKYLERLAKQLHSIGHL